MRYLGALCKNSRPRTSVFISESKLRREPDSSTFCSQSFQENGQRQRKVQVADNEHRMSP